jgi:hypothetical protein
VASGIYRWTVNRPRAVPIVYIGQAKDLVKRKRRYELDWARGEGRTNAILMAAVQKYGRDAVEYEVVEECAVELLTARERAWWHHYSVLDRAGQCRIANLAEPGDTPFNVPEIREKAASKRQAVYTSPEWQANTRRARQEVASRPEFRAKVAARRNDPVQDRARKEAARAAVAKTRRIVSPSGEVVTFTGQSAFCREHGLNPACLSEVLAGKRPHHRGWTRDIEEDPTYD